METPEIIKGIPPLQKIERLSVVFYLLSCIAILILYPIYLSAFIIGAALFYFDYWLMKKSVGNISKKRKNLFFIVLNFFRYLIFVILIAILLFIIKISWLGFIPGLAAGPIFLALSVAICVIDEKIRTKKGP